MRCDNSKQHRMKSPFRVLEVLSQWQPMNFLVPVLFLASTENLAPADRCGNVAITRQLKLCVNVFHVNSNVTSSLHLSIEADQPVCHPFLNAPADCRCKIRRVKITNMTINCIFSFLHVKGEQKSSQQWKRETLQFRKNFRCKISVACKQ